MCTKPPYPPPLLKKIIEIEKKNNNPMTAITRVLISAKTKSTVLIHMKFFVCSLFYLKGSSIYYKLHQL